MKKANKKGFTLIELLAVIVILAIVAAVTMAVIVPMLTQRPLDAAEVSVKEINKAIVNACTAQGMQYGGTDVNPYGTLFSTASDFDPLACESGTCTLSGTTLENGKSLMQGLKINGDAPTSFTVQITACRITSATYTWCNTGDVTTQFNGIRVTGVNESVKATKPANVCG